MDDIITYTLHLLVYFIIRCWQSISWRITGVHKHLATTRNGENYSTSAQLLKVWSRSRNDVLIIFDLHMFITSHIRFVHPEFAMQKHITLMTVTKDYVIFSVPQEDVDVYNTRKYPFLFNAMYKHAEYLLVMPITSFIKLAESIPDTKAKVLWICHAGRCGSTALSQSFNALPNALVMSEPLSFYSLFLSYRDEKLSLKYDQKRYLEYRRLFHCTMRTALKPALKPADIIVLKEVAINAFIDIDMLTDLYPDCKILFMYRDVEQQVSSKYRALYRLLSPKFPVISAFIANIIGKREFITNSCFENPEHFHWIKQRVKNERIDLLTTFVIGWAENCYHYRDIVQRQKLDIPAIKYEHMIANTRGNLSALFEYLGLRLTDEEYRIMQQALDFDSQEASGVSRKIVTKAKVQITPDMIDRANECLKYFGLPKWGETLVLPQTIPA